MTHIIKHTRTKREILIGKIVLLVILLLLFTGLVVIKLLNIN